MSFRSPFRCENIRPSSNGPVNGFSKPPRIPETSHLIFDFWFSPPWCRCMPRIAWVVAPGLPVTQRGNRRQETFWQRHGTWNSIRCGLGTSGLIHGAAHISSGGDDLVKVKHLLERVGNWRDFLLGGVSEEEIERIRRHERTGRPMGNDGFVGKLEEASGRSLQRGKPGRKRGHKQKTSMVSPRFPRISHFEFGQTCG